METDTVITGTVLVAGSTEQLASGSYLRVSLLDVTQTDAVAQPVAETVIQPDWMGVSAQAGISFQLTANKLKKHRSYVLSAMISRQVDCRIAPGDYITMESYPVIPGKQVSYQLILKPV